MLLNFLTIIDESLGEMSLLPGTPTPTTALTTSTVPNLFSSNFTTSISPGLLNSPTAALPGHTSYLSIPHPYAHLPHFPINDQLWKLHNEKTLQVETNDMDVASITETTREVRISEEEEDQEDDKPLDLSMRQPSPSPSTSSHTLCLSPNIHSPSPSSSNEIERPSVIVETSGLPSVRRSASSVGVSSSSSSVQEHFRRSLSGKWPRRQKNDDEKTRASPFPRRASFREHKIIEHSNPSIEEHFRKALSPEAFTKWKQRQNETIT